MKKVYIRKKKINEDDAQQQNTNTDAPQNQQTTSTNPADARTPEQKQQIIDDRTRKIADIQKMVNAEKKKVTDAQGNYSKFLEKVRNTVAAYNAEIAENGGNPVPLAESYSVVSLPEMRFKKKLFEAKTTASQIEELEALFRIAFERVPDNSNIPNHKELHTYARNIKTFLANSGWSKAITPKNHWPELSEKIRSKFEGGTKISNSKRELDSFIKNLETLFRQSSTFSWIFGNIKDDEKTI